MQAQHLTALQAVAKLCNAGLKNAKKKSIAEKIAMHANMSNKKAIKDFGYYKIILRNNPIKELSDEEIEYLNS